ncbi:MAG: cytochrome d ubiquinol oxidase subunit II [Micrococcales bacterium]|nr:cytochrome d ubiquinol oxidase subunit II [Micrococcales bacterium]
MEALAIVWFAAIALLWIGYLLLEGFDLGVGMHMLVSARSENDRRVMLNTIGPVWDGNEVWLITALAGTFAAFPLWYAALLSTLYLPFVLVLVGLIFRAVAIEYRGKHPSGRWIRFWTWALGLGSFVVAFGIGAALALTTTGLPIDANGDRVGGPFAALGPAALLGGLAVVGFCLLHSATFLALKSDGPVRRRATAYAGGWGPFGLLPLLGWMLVVQVQRGDPLGWALVLLGLGGAALGWRSARAGREGRAFAGFAAFLALGVAGIFAAVFPVVLPSTLDRAWDLTVGNAAASPYTLGVMTVVAGFGLPLVLGYQAWSYWVFRRRVAPEHIPADHIRADRTRADRVRADRVRDDRTRTDVTRADRAAR